MLKYIYILLLSISLVSCGKTANIGKELNLKISDYTLSINNDFYASSNKLDIKNIDVIYSYKSRKIKNNFSDSLIIGKYTKTYPDNEKEFFSIILDKFNKQIVGIEFLEKASVDINGNTLFYIKYKVDDNLFGGNEENIYYGLQSYLLDKTKKEVYIISYISLEQDNINNIFDSVKNLKLNE